MEKKKHKEIYKYLTVTFIALSAIFLLIAAIPDEIMPTEYDHNGFAITPTGFEGQTGYLKPIQKTELTNDMRDQAQTQPDPTPFPLPYFPHIGPYALRQKIQNDRGPMEGFKLLLGRHGTPTKNLIVGVIDEPLTGSAFRNLNNWVMAVELQPARISEGQFEWVTIEPFQGTINIPAGQDFWICVVSNDFSDGDGTWYEWATSGRVGNLYAPGYMDYSTDVGDSWHHGVYDEDSCFVTYTSTDGGPEPDFCIGELESYTYQGTTYTVDEITSGVVILSTPDNSWILREGDTFTNEGLTFEVVEVTVNRACFLDITGEPAPPAPPEEPDLSISIDTWVTTSLVASFTSLFAAIVTGTKFLGII